MNVLPIVAGLALVFNGLIRSDNHTLMAMLVMAAFVAAGWMYFRSFSATQLASETAAHQRIEADGRPSGRLETSFAGNKVLPATFPKKGFKYLLENKELCDIIQDIRVLRLIDKSKYSDILALANQLQKTYMYILAGRYDPSTYIPTYMDTREALLELFYGIVFVMPLSFTHVYGISPRSLVNSNIAKLTQLTRLQADVLKSYAEKSQEKHVPDVIQVPAPMDPDRSKRSRLP
jgi:hypothetical protein